MHNYYSTSWMIRRVFPFFSWSWVRVPTAGHGMVTTMDATQEDIVMGIMVFPIIHASIAPLDTIVQAGMVMIAIEN